uniref:Putative lysosome-associated membrane glycoprotein 5 n=1 Tax=Phlebotomus kandelakii TaxID=1109342 RepID=A0A6B2EAK0_9DIPT
MQKLPEKFLLIAIIFCSLLKVAVNLQLEGLSTKKPRITKYTTKSSQSATASPATTSFYRVNATNGATCILIRTDGLLSIQYRNKLGEDKEADVFLPDNVDLKGECYEDESSISMGFKGFVLTMNFKKTPGGERWYINNVDLAYSSSNRVFEHVDRPNLDVKLSTPPHNTLLFPTPVGKSYTCDQERVITMFAQDDDDRSGHLAKLYLRDLRMQSFMYKKASTWGPSYQCSATGTYRDETAPIAVGSTLAVMTLCMITGYGLWRYFKVKKVQYGTME